MNMHEEMTGAKASVAELGAIETSLKLTTEAQMHGLSAMNNLQLQDESVDSARRAMEANEYTLQKAEKVLRGMTWTGTIYNFFAADPTPVTHAPRAGAGAGADAGRAATSDLAGSSGIARGSMPVEAYSNSRVDGSALDPMDDVLKGRHNRPSSLLPSSQFPLAYPFGDAPLCRNRCRAAPQYVHVSGRENPVQRSQDGGH
jgi:hypothetical protein